MPSTVLKIPYTQKSSKTDAPSNVLRLQPTGCTNSQCETYVQKNSKQGIPSSFEIPSSSQVNFSVILKVLFLFLVRWSFLSSFLFKRVNLYSATVFQAPQMNSEEPYNPVSCSNSSSFFPPISSIAQGFTSGKSSSDLVQVWSK